MIIHIYAQRKITLLKYLFAKKAIKSLLFHIAQHPSKKKGTKFINNSWKDLLILNIKVQFTFQYIILLLFTKMLAIKYYTVNVHQLKVSVPFDLETLKKF